MNFIKEEMSYRQQAKEIIVGGYDLHTHTNPSAFPRALNDFELVKEADALGMAGVMIKAHYGCTSSRAALVNLTSGCTTKAYGGLVLNHPTGGLNPYSVENALKMGASIIWMPTRDSKHSLEYGDMPGDFFSRPGITILDSNKKLVSEIYTIFCIVKKYNAFLATGHLSLEESILLCQEGRAMGVNMILTHPEWSRTKVPVIIQKELADLGVLIEKNWLNLAEGDTTVSEMSNHIRAVGSEHIYLATDRGQAGAEHPAEGMLRFIETLLIEGFSHEELITMVQTVPAKIINHSGC
ncbi:MAG: DUF6282 family protein [Clostridium sp.]